MLFSHLCQVLLWFLLPNSAFPRVTETISQRKAYCHQPHLENFNLESLEGRWFLISTTEDENINSWTKTCTYFDVSFRTYYKRELGADFFQRKFNGINTDWQLHSLLYAKSLRSFNARQIYLADIFCVLHYDSKRAIIHVTSSGGNHVYWILSRDFTLNKTETAEMTTILRRTGVKDLKNPNLSNCPYVTLDSPLLVDPNKHPLFSNASFKRKTMFTLWCLMDLKAISFTGMFSCFDYYDKHFTDKYAIRKEEIGTRIREIRDMPDGFLAMGKHIV